MELLLEDDIDFSKYENETDAQERVKPAAVWMAELIESVRRPVKKRHQLLPWETCEPLVQDYC